MKFLLHIQQVLSVDVFISVEASDSSENFKLETVAPVTHKLTDHEFRTAKVVIIVCPDLDFHLLVLVENERDTERGINTNRPSVLLTIWICEAYFLGYQVIIATENLEKVLAFAFFGPEIFT